MILERKLQINISEMKEGQGQLMQQLLHQSGTTDIESSFLELAGLMQLYNAAMKGISTRLEVLDEEFQITHKHMMYSI